MSRDYWLELSERDRRRIIWDHFSLDQLNAIFEKNLEFRSGYYCPWEPLKTCPHSGFRAVLSQEFRDGKSLWSIRCTTSHCPCCMSLPDDGYEQWISDGYGVYGHVQRIVIGRVPDLVRCWNRRSTGD